MNFIIFDDEKRENFYPITLTRSTGDLRVGVLKLRQRLNAYFNIEEDKIIISTDLETIYKERHPEWKINEIVSEDTIFINSRTIIDDEVCEKIKALELNMALESNGEIVAARLIPQTKNVKDIFEQFSKCQGMETEIGLWQYIWQLIEANGEYIQKDFTNFFYEKDNFFETEMGITILDPYNIWLGEGTSISPGVVIDASEGPVILDEGAKIMPNAVIIGPAYIGKNSTIKVGAKIYEGTSIGPVCKVGGEVEESIILAYSNKQHDGFLGHSYLGEWVNLGADTNNSDLKNNYSNVKVYHYPSKKQVDSGTQFMGMVVGDHTKTGINSTINTGTVIGVGCNIYGKDLVTNFTGDFSWGEAGNFTKYRLDKFLETAELVKARRKLKLSEEEKELYKKIFPKEFTL